MNAKFFVPYETAQLLKEKGYNEKITFAYNKQKQVVHAGTRDCNNIDWDNLRKVQSSYPPRLDYIAAPTYHEVLDWLEERGIRIEVRMAYHFREKQWSWCGHVYVVEDEDYETSQLADWSSTREEALNAAILKALEMV